MRSVRARRRRILGLNANWLATPCTPGFKARRPACIESVEARLLLSAYSIADVGSLDATTTGSSPSIALVADSSADLFGTTLDGKGPASYGSVYEIANGSSAITTIATFNYTDGAYPKGFALDASGNIFGTTFQNGNGNNPSYGSLFEIAKGSNTITTVASFDPLDDDGTLPAGRVAFDLSGDLYGATNEGGTGSAPGDGTIFELGKGSSSITNVASFNGSDGANPVGGITLDPSGNLYGTATAGGSNGDGTVFEIANGSRTLTALASFTGTNGSDPIGSLTLDAAGNLFGTASAGGANNDGTVFEIASGTSTMTTIASFNGTNGSEPLGGVTLDGSGNLYGTTQTGGANNDGTVFEIARGSGTIMTLASFNGTDGSDPQATVTLHGGNIYGTALSGGVNGAGAVFELVANPSPAISLAIASGSNPSNATQLLNFTAAESGGVPNGEMISLEDSSNGNRVVATGTLSNGSATLTVPAGTLLAGTHNLIAVYGGDANFAASESAPYTQTVQVVVTKAQVNGNLSSLIGTQRSTVDSILYTFSEPVDISGDAATLAIHSGQTGTLPTSLTWTAINPNNDGSSTQWAVTFSGNGVVGNSIANGVYDITLNSSDVTSDANPSVNVQARPTDTFYRLFGDISGDGVVNASDNFQFKAAMNVYNAAFDYNDDGVVNAADNFQFKNSMSLNFSNSGIVYTI